MKKLDIRVQMRNYLHEILGKKHKSIMGERNQWLPGVRGWHGGVAINYKGT